MRKQIHISFSFFLGWGDKTNTYFQEPKRGVHACVAAKCQCNCQLLPQLLHA